MTVVLPVLELPLASVTVKITVLAPALEQVNVVGFKVTEATVQLSVLPLSTAVAFVEPLPIESKVTVTD